MPQVAKSKQCPQQADDLVWWLFGVASAVDLEASGRVEDGSESSSGGRPWKVHCSSARDFGRHGLTMFGVELVHAFFVGSQVRVEVGKADETFLYEERSKEVELVRG